MTAAVTPLEARCEVCQDTGSKSQEITGDPDCTSCGAAVERVNVDIMVNQSHRRDRHEIAFLAYQLGKAAAAPVVPVASQPVVQQEPVAWLVYAEDHNGMVPQFPAYQVKLQADRYAAMYGQTPTEVRPLYAAPSLEAQPAGEVASDPNAALVAALEALEEVGALEDGLLGDDPKVIKAQKMARKALSAAGQEVGHG